MGNINNISAKNNFNKISANSYPGRGIIIGATPNGKDLVQIYWIMGRSVNSRNRIFVNNNGVVSTKAFDESKLTDPSLVIYSPVRYIDKFHIVSNGDQTDTVYDYIKSGRTFEEALATREFEPDAPNFTPRITGIVEVGGVIEYKLSILKARTGFTSSCDREYYHYDKAENGYGHCIHTYITDGNPLPSFNGAPYLVPIPASIDEAAEMYWHSLNKENRVSLLVKFIDRNTEKAEIKIINANV